MHQLDWGLILLRLLVKSWSFKYWTLQLFCLSVRIAWISANLERNNTGTTVMTLGPHQGIYIRIELLLNHYGGCLLKCSLPSRELLILVLLVHHNLLLTVFSSDSTSCCRRLLCSLRRLTSVSWGLSQRSLSSRAVRWLSPLDKRRVSVRLLLLNNIQSSLLLWLLLLAVRTFVIRLLNLTHIVDALLLYWILLLLLLLRSLL